jgi:uncharacterized protein
MSLSATNDQHIVKDEAALRSLYSATHAIALNKSLPALDKHARDFITRAPFLCLGTQSAEGKADVSPRGDPAGFVKILDDKTLAIPDRPGNNRLDSLSNIIANPNVGLLFIIPGFDDTLRVNGRAHLSTDPDLLAQMAVNNRLPNLAIVIEVSEIFLHCAKAFRRSNLWNPETFQNRREMPSLMQIILDQTTGAPTDEQEIRKIDADLEEEYKQTMY